MGYHPTLLGWYNIIFCSVLLICGYRAPKDSIVEKIGGCKIITFLSDISLEIYGGTGIGFWIFTNVVVAFELTLSNKGNILLSSAIIILVACCLKVYEKVVKKLIKKIGIEKFALYVLLLFVLLIIFKVI